MKIMGIGIPELSIFLLLLWLLFGFATMRVAAKKGYNKLGFFLLGAFLGIIGLIIALCIPDRVITSNQKTDTLLNLKKLLDEGVITQQEFDREKAQLLK